MTAAAPLGRSFMESLRDQIAEIDPDVVVVCALTGSAARGLALSIWTALEGSASEAQAISLINYAHTAHPNS